MVLPDTTPNLRLSNAGKSAGAGKQAVIAVGPIKFLSMAGSFRR